MIPIVAGGGVVTLNGFAIGNVTRFSFQPKFELARYNDYSTGVRRTGKIRCAAIGAEGSFVTDYITGSNMATWLMVNTLQSLVFQAANPNTSGPQPRYAFDDVAIFPNGATELIIQPEGDTWQGLSFGFEATMKQPSVTGIPGSLEPPESEWPPFGVVQTRTLGFIFDTASPLTVLTFLSATRIDEVVVEIETPFDDTRATLSVGHTGNAEGLMARSDIIPSWAAVYSATPEQEYAGADVIKLYIDPGTSTQGSGTVSVKFETA